MPIQCCDCYNRKACKKNPAGTSIAAAQLHASAMRAANEQANMPQCMMSVMRSMGGSREMCLNRLIGAAIYQYNSEPDPEHKRVLGAVTVDRLAQTCDRYARQFTLNDAASLCSATTAAQNKWWESYHA